MIPVEKPWEMASLYSLSCAVYLSPRLLVSSLMNPAQLMNTFGPMWQSWTSWVRFSRRLLFCFKICVTQERRHWSALLLHYTHWEEKTESKDNLSTGKQTKSHLSVSTGCWHEVGVTEDGKSEHRNLKRTFQAYTRTFSLLYGIGRRFMPLIDLVN